MARMFFGITMLVLVGCTGGGRDLDDDDDTTIRSGEEVPLEEQKYYDAKPAISADGDRVVFISGRDEQLKVYKFDSGEGDASRLTGKGDELEDEFEAAISPDGSLVALIGSKDGSTNVHLKKFSGSGDLITIEDEGSGIESQVSFSSDGALLTFVRRSPDKVGAKVYVAEVSNEGAVSNLTQLTASNSDEDDPLFVPTDIAGSYRLTTVRRSTTGFSQAYWIRTLSVGDGVTVDDEQELENIPTFVRDAPFSSGMQTLYFSTRAAEEGEFSEADWVPQGSVATDDKVAVQSVLAAYDIESGRAEKISEDLGIAILAVSASNADDGVVVALTQEAWSCKEDKLAYVTRLKVIKPSDESKTAVTPEYDDDQKFLGLAESVCSEKGKKSDSTLNAAVVNGNGTASSYAVAYVSLYPKGDNEVKLLTYDGDSYSVTDVSKNTD